MHLDQLATNAARSVIVPLDDLAEALDLSESDFAPSVWGPGIYKDKRYGIPLDVHTIAMYYNKDHFEKAGISEPPTDAASLDEACKKLQAAGIEQPFWMPNQWPAHLMFLSLVWQFGGQPYAEDGSEATYADEAGDKALSWMREQVDKGYSPKAVDIDSQYAAFKNGKNSITWDGIWQINDLEEAGTNYGIATLPVIGDELAAWANSHNFFMTKQAADDTNRANAAKTFIGWMSDQSSAWSKAGMVPARNSARKEDAFTELGPVRHPRPGRPPALPAAGARARRRAAEDPGGGGQRGGARQAVARGGAEQGREQRHRADEAEPAEVRRLR